MHMRSDVPVGAFLSSGIDSTAVVALAREFNPNILTFTVGYDVPGYSEIDVAQESARHLGRHHDPDQDRAAGHDGRAAADRLAPRRPGGRPGAGAAVLRGQEGRRARHRGALRRGRRRVLRRLHDLPRAAVAGRASTACPTPMQRGLRAVSKAIPRGGQGQELPGAGHHPDRGALLRQRPDLHRGGEAAACCAATTRRCATPTSPRRSTPRCAELDDVTKMQYVDLYTWLRGDILVKADRMSMAHSLELRVPFLDREVFDGRRRRSRSS